MYFRPNDKIAEYHNYIRECRIRLHSNLLHTKVFSLDARGIPSNADKDNKKSVKIAKLLYEIIRANHPMAEGLHTAYSRRPSGQQLGSLFENAVREYVENALDKILPGKLECPKKQKKISNFAQYSHLKKAEEVLTKMRKLASETAFTEEPDAMLQSNHIKRRHLLAKNRRVLQDLRTVADDLSILLEYNYLITPDVLVVPRAKNATGERMLYANISCKWTLRSDRAQSAIAEAYTLFRLRRGRAPQMVVVTGEPLPSRLASLVLGTGDIDCVYHFALNELKVAIDKYGESSLKGGLEVLQRGGRLRDIGDLPLDLTLS